LPNLRDRTPAHVGQGLSVGQAGGVEAVTLAVNQLPPHSHALMASAEPATSADPSAKLLAKKPRFGADVYAAPSASVTTLAPASLTNAGGSQAHSNLQPYLVLNFVIALQGIFPSAT
jgi:microcystin-dependent protein